MADSTQQEKAISPEQSEVASLVLSIEAIQPYERNPRRGHNPEYDRIKDSIRANGLDQPLVVTRRPDKTDYIVHSGGNTRLLILKELYEETGDEQFSCVQCLFKRWDRESEVLLAHLRENDLRGSLIFIDRALAIFEIKQLLEEELDLEELSQRQLEMSLHASGYALSQGLISRMGYAVHRLLPLLPLALNSGMGRPQILRIRALDRAGLHIWNKHGLDEEDFDEVFATLCRRYDASECDIGLLRDAIEKEIAEQSETSLQVVRVELQAQLAGRELTVPEFEDDSCENVEDTEKPARASKSPSVGGDARIEPQIDLGRPEVNTIQNLSVGDANGDSTVFKKLSSDTPTQDVTQTVEPKLATEETDPNDLKSLRGRAWTLAARLAQRNGIGDLVVPLPDKGLGFILSDVPAPALADQLDDDTLSQVSMVWWHLAASAEMTVAPVDSIAALLPPDSVLRQALEQQDAGLLFNSVWTLDPGHTGYRLWRRLGKQDWGDLLSLMDIYRQIRHLVEETETKIWE